MKEEKKLKEDKKTKEEKTLKEDKKHKEEKKLKEDNKYQEMYNKLMNYENELHIRNQKRIKIGLRCIWTIPALFLFLLFVTESSKVIFLVLWIVSLFAIAVYLIYVEYMDYKLQEKINYLSGENNEDVDSLIDVAAVEGRARAFKKNAEERIETRREELRL